MIRLNKHKKKAIPKMKCNRKTKRQQRKIKKVRRKTKRTKTRKKIVKTLPSSLDAHQRLELRRTQK